MVNNICAIQARMGSNRLPGKSLFKLGNETIIERCYIAASYVDLFSSVVVLTSNESKDDELCNYLETKNINYKRGSLNNVLSRFSNVIKDTKADNIVRLTGDNPLIDPEIIEGVLKKHLDNNSEYTSNIFERNFPRGNDVECISGKTLLSLEKENLNEEDKEHVTLFIRKNIKNYKFAEYKINKKINFPDARLTIDYIEDYKLISKIYKDLNLESKKNSYLEIDQYLSKNKDLMKINSGIEQTKINNISW